MPEHWMIFNLPEDEHELKLAMHGPKFYNVLFELDGFMRGMIKHGHDFKDPNDIAQAIRDKLHDELDGLDLYEL